MLDVVLFELEGVLAATRDARRASLRQALGENGVFLAEPELETRCDGASLRVSIEAALALRMKQCDETLAALIAHRAEHLFSSWIGKGVSLADGAVDLVRDLHGRARLAVVTRASRRDADFILALAGLDDAFECVVGDEDAHPPKPDAAPYVTAIERLARRRAFRIERSVTLEDSASGIRSARAAHLRCIAVGEIPAHVAMDADAFLPSLQGQSLASIDALMSASGELSR